MIALGLGSNVGDSMDLLRRAIRRLRMERKVFELQTVSPVYVSKAMLPEGAPADWDHPYLNLAVLGESELKPRELLAKLKEFERDLGRKDRGKWAPREIDIDILAWEGVELRTQELTLPHPGLEERPFALLPLADLLPGLPQAGSLAERAAALRSLPIDEIPFETRRELDRSWTEWVGVLNITPDSFSDGGRFNAPDAARERAKSLVTAGAGILDIGAESTRPGAVPVAPDEEWKRLEPVLRSLTELRTEGWRFRISVDTRHAEVARKALESGADWLNDVTGFQDPELTRVAAASSAQVVVMHSLGVPPLSTRTLPEGEDPMDHLVGWGAEKIDQLISRGIDRERIILDPGIGFGKTPVQALEVLRGIRRLSALGVRVLVGHSRKSFLSLVTPKPAAERDPETTGASIFMASQGVDYLRVHDVETQARAMRAWTALDGVIRC